MAPLERREAEGTGGHPATPGVKKCPFCAEEIKAEAIKCRYCGEMLSRSEGERPSTTQRITLLSRATAFANADRTEMLGSIRGGSELRVLEEHPAYYRVSLNDGSSCYIEKAVDVPVGQNSVSRSSPKESLFGEQEDEPYWPPTVVAVLVIVFLFAVALPFPFVVIPVAAAICGILTSYVAASKGHGAVSWFWIGFLFGVLGLLAAVGMRDKH